MMYRLLRGIGLLFVAAVLVLVQCEPALADGGIVIPDPDLWAMIEEGQQMAVIRLNEDNTAQVDLFVTMVDRTGRSHEVTFFIPLGVEASDFQVVEETSLDFDRTLTESLDEKLREYAKREAGYRSTVQSALLLGTLTTNGLWTWGIVIPLLLSGCAPLAPVPVATFQTESSFISIYQMDEQTDVQALIETTGLDPKVSETLESLQGQQIAVVELQTHPETKEDDWLSDYEQRGQPGIHMTWTTTLVSHSEEASYTYPLGTGKAWASPIELTRVYVVAPKSTDFTIEYPRLGTDLSGMEGGALWGGLAGRIYWRIDEAKSPGFASDHAYGSYGHIWRATYVKSNSDRDITVVKLPDVSRQTRAAIQRSRAHKVVTGFTWIVSLVIGAAIWLVAWWLVMTRVCKVPYRWREGRLWEDALKWSLIHPAIALGTMFAVGFLAFCMIMLLLGIYSFASDLHDAIVGSEIVPTAVMLFLSLPILVAATGLVNAYLFARWNASRMNVSRWRAFGAYVLVIVTANVMYAVFAIAYSGLVGVL